MTTDIVQAPNDIAATFHAQWALFSSPIAGYVPEIRYPGVKEPAPPIDKVWGRFSTTVVDSGQTTLRNGATKRHTVAGNVFVQLFAPIGKADGVVVLRQLGNMGLRAFAGRSLSGNIWFRRPRATDLPNESAYYRLNIIAEYEFDTSI